jgi:hypothetical protein
MIFEPSEKSVLRKAAEVLVDEFRSGNNAGKLPIRKCVFLPLLDVFGFVRYRTILL